jgi:hypothetical protein
MSTLLPMLTSEDDPHGIHLRLSAQRALWGAVGPHVEMIYVGYVGMKVRFLAIVDKDLPDDEREALSDAAGEIISDYPRGWGLDEACVEIDERPADAWLVYQRYQREIYAAPQA